MYLALNSSGYSNAVWAVLQRTIEYNTKQCADTNKKDLAYWLNGLIRVAIDIIWADHTENIQLFGGRVILLFNLF